MTSMDLVVIICVLNALVNAYCWIQIMEILHGGDKLEKRFYKAPHQVRKTSSKE